jgi:hypothetical protein
MGRRKDVERADYYRQEASTCARAALTSAIADIKQAYLELEQGWLSLAPKPKESLDDLSVAEPGGNGSGNALQPVSDEVVGDANCHRDHAGRRLAATAFGGDQARNRYSPPIGRDNNASNARLTNPHRAGRNGRADEARNS